MVFRYAIRAFDRHNLLGTGIKVRFESVDGLQLPKVGFGTWKIGGGSFANRSQDARGLAALRSAIQMGYTVFDTAELYGAGHTEELLGQAVLEIGVPRESLLIISKVRPEHLRYEAVLKACEASLRRLRMDYLDLYLIHWPGGGMRLSDTFRALNKLVSDGKVRRLGVSNFDLRLIKASEEHCETPLLTNQVPYSVSDRTYVGNGVMAYCRQRGILITAYSPLGQGHFNASKALRAVAEAHSATPQQIAIAWLTNQPGVITIPMSQEPEHQRQNLSAADITLTEPEMAQLA